VAAEKQILANRRNAKASTGPKTAAGRDKSSRNSLKHGLTASQVTVFDESPAAFVLFHKRMSEARNPADAFEEQLVEEIACCAWRLRRSRRIEAALFEAGRLAAEDDFAHVLRESANREEAFLTPESGGQELSEEYITQAREITRQKRISAVDTFYNQDTARFVSARSIGSVFQGFAKTSDPMTSLLRYETSIERSFYRALHNLERAQARRKGETVAAPLAVDIANKN